jgi:AcrR family transcriptional regulator
MSARRNRVDRSAQTRDQLLAAAEQLLAARDLDVVSVDEITRAAGVSKGTLYTHFADKNDLAAAITRRSRKDLEERISAQNESLTDAAVRLANGLAATFVLAIVDPVRARARLRLQPFDPDAP